MATATGIVTLALTPGIWTQGPSQAATAISIDPLPGLQVSLNNGTTFVKHQADRQLIAPGIKANLNEFYFRIFGAPVSVNIAWSQ